MRIPELSTLSKSRDGFTLTEILIVVAILVILMAILMTNWQKQIKRGFDAQRKADLAKIARALEEYYNDHGCYPPDSPTFDYCGRPNGTGLRPYMDIIPCDPESKLPYNYEPVNGDPCQGHRTYANLSDTSDPDISRLGCINGCFNPNYNYGVSSGVPVGYGSGAGAPTPTPDPTAVWACTGPLGNCQYVGSQTCSGSKYSDGVDCSTNHCNVPADLVTCW